MNEIETFFYTWRYTATAAMSFCSFLFICYRVYKSHRADIQDRARAEQRKEWQAEFFDRNYDDFKELRDKYEEVIIELAEIKFILKS